MEKEKIHETSGFILKLIKVFIFASLIVSAGFMYGAGLIVWGNDLVLTAGLLVALNKLDNLGSN